MKSDPSYKEVQSIVLFKLIIAVREDHNCLSLGARFWQMWR
jgi:hypothetical protein